MLPIGHWYEYGLATDNPKVKQIDTLVTLWILLTKQELLQLHYELPFLYAETQTIDYASVLIQFMELPTFSIKLAANATKPIWSDDSRIVLTWPS